jgi:anion-transporting  ArsA/GET3 family ATPase
VFGNRVVRRLLRAIPGLDDFAILGKVWHEACRARSYDTIIFDGPASGHLRLVLGVPEAICETIAEGPLTREAVAMRDALRDREQSATVLVGLPEPWPLTELAELATALGGEIGVHVGALVVNKLWSEQPPALSREHISGAELDPQLTAMLELAEGIGDRGREQREIVAEWLAGLDYENREDAPLLSVPWWPWGIEDRARLTEVLAAVREQEDAADA